MPVDALLPTLVVIARVHYDGAIVAPVKCDFAFGHFVNGGGALGACRGLIECAHMLPLTRGQRRVDDFPMHFVTGRKSGDKRVVAEQFEVVFVDHLAVGDIEKIFLVELVLGDEFGDLLELLVIEFAVGGVAVLDFSQQRDVAFDTEQREYELLEIRSLVLAESVGNVRRCSTRNAVVVVSPDVDRGGVKSGLDRCAPRRAGTL